MNRQIASWTMVWERPQAPLATEYTRIEAISARVRPTRSARNPKASPPMAEAKSVSEFSSPPSALPIPRSRMRCASTRE
jgi:hypothetical protein